MSNRYFLLNCRRCGCQCGQTAAGRSNSAPPPPNTRAGPIPEWTGSALGQACLPSTTSPTLRRGSGRGRKQTMLSSTPPHRDVYVTRRGERDVFDEQVTRSFSQDDYPDYRANVGGEDLSLLRLLIVVIVHGSWPSAHSRDVYGVCALDEIAHELDIGGVCSANHGSSGTMQETFKAKARRDSTATPSARGKRCQRPAERARGQAPHLGPRR